MPVAHHRPLLGESEKKVSRSGGKIKEVEDVLHHPSFLVVGLFNEKGVVFDRFGELRRGRGVSGVASKGEETPKAKSHQKSSHDFPSNGKNGSSLEGEESVRCRF